MKKLFLVTVAVLGFGLVTNSSSVRAETADTTAKNDQELAKELAALRKQIDRLQVEVHRLRAEGPAVNTKRDAPKLDTPSLSSSTAAISPAAANAYAADLPVKAPPKGAAVGASGVYAWLDGSYQRVNLPNYSLGLATFNIGPATLSGPIQNFDAHADGYGIGGGVGYLLPFAPTSPWFGSDLRVEVAGWYVNASATQIEGTTLLGPTTAIGATFLNGTGSGFVGCVGGGGGGPCQLGGSLHTQYASWQVNGRLASDYRFGFFTLTPSIGLLGGNAHTNQTLAQAASQLSVPNSTVFYHAATRLNWDDLGGRLGLEGKYAVHPWVTLGLGGWVGWVDRWTNFSGTDGATISPLPPPVTFGSTVASSATKTSFLANLEANVNVTPTPHWTGRAFIGLNYDNSVPGISTPSLAGPTFAPISMTQAGIVYSKESSYYAGGGVTYRFY